MYPVTALPFPFGTVQVTAARLPALATACTDIGAAGAATAVIGSETASLERPALLVDATRKR